jgi:hypothetical protein
VTVRLLGIYDATGSDNVTDSISSESPVNICVLDGSWIDWPNVPDVDADHRVIHETISPFVPAHDDQVCVSDETIDPPDADAQVIASRVVTDETLDVPADPGSPVCNWT